MTNCDPWPERHRDYLHLLGMMQLDQGLIGRVDLSGVVQNTMLEAYQQAEVVPLAADEQTMWLRRVFMNSLLDERR